MTFFEENDNVNESKLSLYNPYSLHHQTTKNNNCGERKNKNKFKEKKTCKKKRFKCDHTSIFDSITEFAPVKTKLNTLQLLIEDESKHQVKSILDLIKNYPSSHLSFNAILSIILNNSDFNNYDINKNHTQVTKDLDFYSRLCNRIFFPNISTNVTIDV